MEMGRKQKSMISGAAYMEGARVERGIFVKEMECAGALLGLLLGPCYQRPRRRRLVTGFPVQAPGTARSPGATEQGMRGKKINQILTTEIVRLEEK